MSNQTSKKAMQTFVINPDTHKPVTLDEWAKDKDPKRATLLLLKTEGYSLIIAKNLLDGEYTFDEAQKAAAAFKPEGLEAITFRCPTRKECIDIYDARFLGGLDDALKLVGGDPMRGWIWTSEVDADEWFARRYGAYSAWLFYQVIGTLYISYVFNALRCRACALLTD